MKKAHYINVIQQIRLLVSERNWDQFHSEVNLAKSISIEAAELLECFQWSNEEFESEAVLEELADVLTYCYLLADKLGHTPEEIILNKLEVTFRKYPVEKARGRSAKYDEL